jgi:hypothetical protein
MKKNHLFIFVLAIFTNIFVQNVSAQVTTNSSSGLAASYSSLANAITALNSATLTGPVIITLSGNETAPIGGYVITQSGGTSTNTIVIQGSSSTITAFSPQTIASINDAIFKIIGGDYISIQNFTMQENAGNTINTTAALNNMTEFGVALFYASDTNGAQYNIIQNNTITLNRTYKNTIGIYSNASHTATVMTTLANASTANGANSFNKVYSNTISNLNFGIVFIGSSTAGALDNGNDIGGSSIVTGNIISNWGGGAALSSYNYLTGNNYCIFDNHQYNDNISYNTITSATGLATTTFVLGGILKNYSAGQPSGTILTTINNNTITLTNAPTTGGMYGINNQGLTSLSSATVNISNNSILNCAITGTVATSAGFTAIANTSACGILNMNYNIIRGNSSTATTGGFSGILNTGSTVTSCNINHNQIGNDIGGAISLSAITTGNVYGIYNTAGATSCNLSINNNNFQGFTYGRSSSGVFRCIYTTAVVLTATINTNNFNNLTINSSTGVLGFLIGASNSTPTVAISGNYVTTQFKNSYPAIVGNYIAIANSNGTPTTGSSTISNNNLSNISFSDSSAFGGVIYWSSGSGTTCSHNISVTGNTIYNISNLSAGGPGQLAGLQGIQIGLGNMNVIANNDISFLNAAGGNPTAIIGGAVSTNAGGITNVYNNIIHDIKSTSYYGQSGGTIAGTATGISIASGPAINNVFKNKIYDISNTVSISGTGGLAVGISVSQATSTCINNIYNNYIGKIYSEKSTYYQAVRGISLSNTVGNTTNLYYNTIYLDGNCEGYSFCFYKASSTPVANLRNNIFVNHAVGTGGLEQMVYWMIGSLSATYTTTSNNNLLYINPSDTLNLIYADGAMGALTNKKYAMAAFKSFTGPIRENSSVSENVSFLNTSFGSDFDYLHIDPAVPTLLESGAVNIATYTDDFDGNIRQGNSGYAGAGIAPDIGADEFDASPQDWTPPVISYNPLGNTASLANRLLTATISDISGLGSGTNQAVLYWKINNSAYTGPIAPTSINGNLYTFSFGAGVAANDIVSYFIVAQDASVNSNVGSYPAGAVVTANPPLASSGPALPSSYNVGSICGTKTVGIGGNYTTLTAAINDLNSKEISCPVVLSLLDASYPSETFPIIINANPGASAVNTLTIKPASGVTVSINGALSSGALIKILNNYTTIDGSANVNGTSRDLTISNSSSTSPQVLNVSSNGTIPVVGVNVKNSIIVNGSNGSSAIIVSDVSGTAGYFNNITIQNNSIQKAYIGIYALATVATANGSGLLINSNDLNSDTTNSIRLVGIYVQGVDGATVSNNNIGNILNANAESPKGIWFATGTINGTISGNKISNLSLTNTGAYSLTAIYVSPGSLATSINITNNTISNLNNAGSGTSFGGILTSSPNTNITNNSISNLTQNGAIAFWGIMQSAAVNASCSGNTVSSIKTTNTGVASGINIQGLSTGLNITRNKIFNIKNTNSAGYSSNGLALASTSTNANITVSNNFIYDIAAKGYESLQTDNGYGINIYSGGGYKIYYNSVNLATNQTNTLGIPACLIVYPAATANSLDVRNNIFSIPATTGANRCAIICNNPSVFTDINHNNYYTSGPNLGNIGGSYVSNLAALKMATTKDSNSVTGNPMFVSDSNLHIQIPVISPVNNAATIIASVSDDIDGNTRTSTPDIGADEYTFTPLPVLDASAVSATTISSSQINLAFVPNANNNNVIIVFNQNGIFTTPAGTPPAIGNTFAGGILLSDGTISPFHHTFLTAYTTYYYKIFSYDGISYSPGVSVNTTTCAVQPAPFTEAFETTPSCWTYNTSANNWQFISGVSAYGSGNGSAYANFYTIYSGNSFDLLSLEFNANSLTAPMLKFDYAYATFNGQLDSMNVFYSNNNGLTWNSLIQMPGGTNGILNTAGSVSGSFVPNNANQWATQSLSLPAGCNKIKFTAISANGNNLYLDNVSVIETPVCPVPVSLSASGITSDSAKISWSGATTVDIDYGFSGHIPGSGTVLSSLTSPNPYPLVGLVSGTLYDVYVRQECSVGFYSSWVGPISFTTVCPIPTALNTISIATDNAKIGWAGSAADFDLEYGIAPYTFTGIATKTGITSNSYTIIGLNPSTHYQYKIKSNCSTGNASAWSTEDGFTTDAITIPGLWTGAVSTDWSDSLNWSNLKLPNDTVNVSIPPLSSTVLHQPHISTTLAARCLDLTIESGAVLTIDAQKALKVNGSIFNNAGANGLVLKAKPGSATASLYHTTAGVPAKVEAFVPHYAADEFHMLATPLDGQAIDPDFNIADGFYTWNELGGLWTAYNDPDFSVVNAGTLNFVPGKGYAVSYPDTVTKIFTGTLTQGNFGPISLTNTITSLYPGWHFVANPYPSPIDWDVVTNNGLCTGLDDQPVGAGSFPIWIWNPDPQYGNYGIYQNGGNITNNVTNIIPVAQGFWVKTDNSPVHTFSLDNTVRLIDNLSAPLYKSTVAVADRVRLKVTGSANTFSDEMLVNFGNVSDQKGVQKMFSLYANAPGLYSPKMNKNYSINALTTIADHPIVPISFRAGANGNYTLHASELNSFATPTYIYLKDLATNMITDLNQHPDYTFAATTTDNAMRFQLLFALSPLGISNNASLTTNIYANNSSIYINSSETIKTIAIYNTLGQLIKSITNSGTNFVDMKDAVTGYYIVRLVTTKNVYVEKVMIK